MPIYEYVCGGCGESSEILVRGSKTPACPSCGSAELERQLSLPTVHSEGSRNLSLRAARKRDAARQEDRTREQLKYEESHDRHG